MVAIGQGMGRRVVALITDMDRPLTDTAGNALFAVATTESLLSVAAVLGQLYPVVTVLLARVVLGERISAGQGAGVISAFAGVALITAG